MIPLDWFTPMEREVWTRRQQGMGNAAIAAELAVSEENVSVMYCYAKRRVRNEGPKATGRCDTEARLRLARIDAQLASQPVCLRCGLRGEHLCLAGSAWERRAPEWVSEKND